MSGRRDSMETGQDLFDHYTNSGFSFDPDLLSRYALSLHSKPFVILSGISGTGKTKIAQLFPMEQLQKKSKITQKPAPSKQDLGRISVKITAGIRHGDPRGNIKKDHMDTIFESAELSEIKAKIPVLAAANNEDNIIDPVTLTIVTPEGGEEKMGVYVQRASSPLIRLRSKSKRGETPEYDFQPYLQKNFQVDDILTLKKLGPYRFEIVGANEADKSAAETEREAFLNEVDKQLFIPVRSDWTDQSEIFGYYDSLSQAYIVTPILKFLLDAIAYPEAPFHLILDEMNLSKVEHYFSDFLSCLESRVSDAKGDITQAAVSLHNYGGYVNASDPLVEEVPSKIELPSNLYVTGTVNVDETTYMFSPKVLDRSNVIEFNEVKLDEIGTARSKGPISLERLPKFGHHKPVSQDDFKSLNKAAKETILSLHKSMSVDNSHFGYRTAFEMARFINSVHELIGTADATNQAALDSQIVQKLLPKLNGSQAELEDLLVRLMVLILGFDGGEAIDIETLSNTWLANDGTERIQNSSYALSLRKLASMLIEVRIKGFTAFIN